jgi:hypothetical protein
MLNHPENIVPLHRGVRPFDSLKAFTNDADAAELSRNKASEGFRLDLTTAERMELSDWFAESMQADDYGIEKPIFTASELVAACVISAVGGMLFAVISSFVVAFV